MKKIKTYRVLGYILFWYGIIGYLANLFVKAQERGLDFSFAAIFGMVVSLGLNFFLWGGLILLWRADINENPNIKSKWLKAIIPYAIFTGIVVGMLIMAIIVPNMARISSQ